MGLPITVPSAMITISTDSIKSVKIADLTFIFSAKRISSSDNITSSSEWLISAPSSLCGKKK